MEVKIDAVFLLKGESNRDFGRGFYVSKFRKHAETWAKIIGAKQETKGFVAEFKFYERAFTDDTYKTLRFPDYNEDWLDFVVLNRDKQRRSSDAIINRRRCRCR